MGPSPASLEFLRKGWKVGPRRYTLPFNSPQLLGALFNEQKIQSTACKYNRFVSILGSLFSKFETVNHCYLLYQQLPK